MSQCETVVLSRRDKVSFSLDCLSARALSRRLPRAEERRWCVCKSICRAAFTGLRRDGKMIRWQRRRPQGRGLEGICAKSLCCCSETDGGSTQIEVYMKDFCASLKKLGPGSSLPSMAHPGVGWHHFQHTSQRLTLFQPLFKCVQPIRKHWFQLKLEVLNFLMSLAMSDVDGKHWNGPTLCCADDIVGQVANLTWKCDEIRLICSQFVKEAAIIYSERLIELFPNCWTTKAAVVLL